MDLNITRFFNEAGMIDYSASAAEIGQDAGAVTWAAANEDSSEFPLLTTEAQREEFREYVAGFGAWERSEITAWSDTELNALCMQLIAGDIREAFPNGTDNLCDVDWQEYYARAERGVCSGRLSRNDDGAVYYYVGS